MDYSLKWWQYGAIGILILINGFRMVTLGGSIAAIYARLTGVVVGSVVLVYGVVLIVRALGNVGGESSTEQQGTEDDETSSDAGFDLK